MTPLITSKQFGLLVRRAKQFSNRLLHTSLYLALLGNVDLREKQFLFCMIHPKSRLCRLRFSTLRKARNWIHSLQDQGYGDRSVDF